MKKGIYLTLTVICLVVCVVLSILFYITHWNEPRYLAVFGNFNEIIGISIIGVFSVVFMVLYKKEGKDK